MINTNDLYIVHYCHPNCSPFQNMMRLPQEKAFAKAAQLAADNPNTSAFYRFADFVNYYPLRLKTDEMLYKEFVMLGGTPKEKHPLYFALQGSEYLRTWFGNGPAVKIKLHDIPSESISFTYGDSCAGLEKTENLKIVTKETLLSQISNFNGTLDDFMSHIEKKYTYIEAQLWNDDLIPDCEIVNQRKIEDDIKDELALDDQKTALDFVDYLRNNNLEFIRGDGYWKDKMYYLIKCGGSYVCFISINDPDEKDHRWTVWSDDMNSISSENYPIDKALREIAWKHVDNCANCGSCNGGKYKLIFGKAFDKVCGCTFRIDNPKAEELQFLKKMVDIRKKEILTHTKTPISDLL